MAGIWNLFFFFSKASFFFCWIPPEKFLEPCWFPFFSWCCSSTCSSRWNLPRFPNLFNFLFWASYFVFWKLLINNAFFCSSSSLSASYFIFWICSSESWAFFFSRIYCLFWFLNACNYWNFCAWVFFFISYLFFPFILINSFALSIFASSTWSSNYYSNSINSILASSISIPSSSTFVSSSIVSCLTFSLSSATFSISSVYFSIYCLLFSV